MLGLAGFVINCFPVEMFPGVHLIFGDAVAMVVAVKSGPFAGGLVGFVAGLRTWSLWNQPLPFSALLYCLEGVWVGMVTKGGKRGPLVAALYYWLLLGSWLNLLGQHFLFGLPLRTALILQARSIINGALIGLACEAALLVYEVLRARRAHQKASQIPFESVIMLALVMLISLPIFYITLDNISDMRRRAMSDLMEGTARDLSSVEGELSALVQSYRRGVAIAASIASAHGTMGDQTRLQTLLASVRKLYPEFAGMYVADQKARTIAFDPLYNDMGEYLVGLDYSDREYYRDLLATRSTVYSGVYQARGGMTGPAVAIAEPVIEGDKLVGFVLGWFDVNRSFQKLIARYGGEGESLIITDAKGGLIADSSLEPGSYQQVRSLSDSSDFKSASEGTKGSIFLSSGKFKDKPPAFSALSDDYLLSYTTMPATGWKIWIKRSLLSTKVKLENVYLHHSSVLALALFLTLVLSRKGSRLLSKPIRALCWSAERLAAGDFSGRPPKMQLITAEFNLLFRSFELMAENFQANWERQQQLLREASAAKSELEATFDAMNDGVVLIDVQDRLIRANRAYCRLKGVEPDLIIGRPFTQVAHPEGNWQDCQICRIRRLGQSAVILLEPEQTPLRKYLEIRLDQIYNSEGERIGSVQVVRDLSDVRRARMEADRASALLRNLVESTYDAIYATDLEGKFLWANLRAAELFGFDESSLKGEPFLHSVHPDDLEKVRGAFDAAKRGTPQQCEARYVTSQNLRYVLMTHSPVYVEGQIIAILGIARDITSERLEMERVMRDDKLRALGQLASGIAHNFNNSLTAIIGYTQMALRNTKDLSVANNLKTVEKAAMDAARMIQRIQDFAQQQQKELFSTADANQLVRDSLELTRSRWRDDAQAKGISYQIVFRPSDSLMVECDPSALREVFVNLILNALDAMPSGGKLTITTAIDRGSAVIAFADTGCGMTEETKKRIFEPFFTTKGVKGYGMGLSVTYGIIERHGGHIEVESEPGRGSRFTLRLPLRQDPYKGAGRLREILQEEPRARPAHILIVDDEAPIRALLSDLLRSRGHKVLSAEDGLAGIRAIKDAPFDMIITDLSMPGADGWAVATEARARCPNAKLIVMTGYGDLMGQDQFERPQVDAFVSKPFTLAEIDSLINRLLLERQ